VYETQREFIGEPPDIVHNPEFVSLSRITILDTKFLISVSATVLALVVWIAEEEEEEKVMRASSNVSIPLRPRPGQRGNHQGKTGQNLLADLASSKERPTKENPPAECVCTFRAAGGTRNRRLCGTRAHREKNL
jgi:hypothetical protein